MVKDGDRIVQLANLINLEEMAKRREELAKAYRLIVWKTEKKLTDLMEGHEYQT